MIHKPKPDADIQPRPPGGYDDGRAVVGEGGQGCGT